MTSSSNASLQYKLLYVASLLVALLLIGVGAQLVFLGNDVLSSGAYYALSAASIVGVVSLIAPAKDQKSWLPALAMAVLAFYFLLRGFGEIKGTWIATAVGLGCWVTALAITYLMHPARTSNAKTK